MTIKTYYSKLSWEAAVNQAKAEGHKLLGYTVQAACFEDLIIVRCYEWKCEA